MKMENYKNCVESRNVFNLSSIDLPIIDLFSLECGHGFVLYPSNKVKEEELLVLEGFRFLDRLGKADQDKVNDEKVVCLEDNIEVQYKQISSTNSHAYNRFVKNDFIPDDLQIHKPVE